MEQEKHQLFKLNEQSRMAVSKSDTFARNIINDKISQAQKLLKKSFDPKLEELIPKIKFEQLSSQDVIIIEEIIPHHINFDGSNIDPELNLYLKFTKGKNWKEYLQ